MAYYKEHAHEGRDEASLAELRERCAALVSEQARHGRRGGRAGRGDPLLRLSGRRPGPPCAPRPRTCAWSRSPTGTALCRGCWRTAGWTACSTGRSPRPRPARASRTRRSSPRRWSWPAVRPLRRSTSGDTADEDVAGARAAGIRPLLIDRDGSAAATSPRWRRSISISEMQQRTEYAGFWRRALAIALDNAVWLIGIPMILGWLPIDLRPPLERRRPTSGPLVVVSALVQLLRLLRVALGPDHRQERGRASRSARWTGPSGSPSGRRASATCCG